MDESTKKEISEHCSLQFYRSNKYFCSKGIIVRMNDGQEINVLVSERKEDGVQTAITPVISPLELAELHTKIRDQHSYIHEICYPVDSSPESSKYAGRAAKQNCVMVHAVFEGEIKLYLHEDREKKNPDPFTYSEDELSTELESLADANNKSTDIRIEKCTYGSGHVSAHIDGFLLNATGLIHYHGANITEKQRKLLGNVLHGQQLFISPEEYSLLLEMHDDYNGLNEDLILPFNPHMVYYYTLCILSAPSANTIEIGPFQENHFKINEDDSVDKQNKAKQKQSFYLAAPDTEDYNRRKNRGILMLPDDLVLPGNESFEIGRTFFDTELQRNIVVLRNEKLFTSHQLNEIRSRLEESSCHVLIQIPNDNKTQLYAQQIRHNIEKAGFRITNLIKLLTAFARPEDNQLYEKANKSRALSSTNASARQFLSADPNTAASQPLPAAVVTPTRRTHGKDETYGSTPYTRTKDMSEEMQAIASNYLYRIKQRIAPITKVAAQYYKDAFMGLMVLNGFSKQENGSWKKSHNANEIVLTINTLNAEEEIPKHNHNSIYIICPEPDDENQALTFIFRHGETNIKASLNLEEQNLSDEHQLFHQIHKVLRDELTNNIISTQPVRQDLYEVKSYANVLINCSDNKEQEPHKIDVSPITVSERVTEAVKAYEQLVKECFASGMILLKRIRNHNGQDIAFIFREPNCKRAYLISHPTDELVLTKDKVRNYIQPLLDSEKFASYDIHSSQLIQFNFKHKLPRYINFESGQINEELKEYPFIDISSGIAVQPSGNKKAKQLIFLTEAANVENDDDTPSGSSNPTRFRNTNAQKSCREKIREYLRNGYNPTVYNIKRVINGKEREFTIATVFRRDACDIPVIITAPSDKHSVVTPQEVEKALKCIHTHHEFLDEPLIVKFEDQQQPEQAEIHISQCCGQVYSERFKSTCADSETASADIYQPRGIVDFARDFLGINKTTISMNKEYGRNTNVIRLKRKKPTLIKGLENHWKRYWKVYVAAGLIAGSIVAAGLTFGASLIAETGLIAMIGAGLLGSIFFIWFGMEEKSFRDARKKSEENFTSLDELNTAQNSTQSMLQPINQASSPSDGGSLLSADSCEETEEDPRSLHNSRRHQSSTSNILHRTTSQSSIGDTPLPAAASSSPAAVRTVARSLSFTDKRPHVISSVSDVEGVSPLGADSHQTEETENRPYRTDSLSASSVFFEPPREGTRSSNNSALTEQPDKSSQSLSGSQIVELGGRDLGLGLNSTSSA